MQSAASFCVIPLATPVGTGRGTAAIDHELTQSRGQTENNDCLACHSLYIVESAGFSPRKPGFWGARRVTGTGCLGRVAWDWLPGTGSGPSGGETAVRGRRVSGQCSRLCRLIGVHVP
jgi:hypothetical protein